MSIYIHIPFCLSICSYCDFCKMFKNKVNDYLSALEKEIKTYYKGEEVNTLYIGGGTPSSLDLKELKKLFKILSVFNYKNAEITFEANSEDLTLEKLNFLKNKVNRLSIGIQSFDDNILKLLNRKLNMPNINNAFKMFDNINLDLMYGFKNQNLKNDLENLIKLNPKHISTYSLILEPHTKLYIDKYKPISDDKERKCYDYIISYLKKYGYKQYEFSNFSKEEYASKHNLVYWNNDKYYGFGLNASGYIDNVRYENTRSLNEYLKGNFRKESHELTKEEDIQNEFILGFRKIEGINKLHFLKKYNIQIKSFDVVKDLLNKKLLLENKENIYINPKYLYTSNEILVKFLDITLHEH